MSQVIACPKCGGMAHYVNGQIRCLKCEQKKVQARGSKQHEPTAGGLHNPPLPPPLPPSSSTSSQKPPVRILPFTEVSSGQSATYLNKSASSTTTSTFRRGILADDYRVEGENLTLSITLGVTGFVLLIVLGLSFCIILIPVVLTIIYIKVRQGQLLGQGLLVSRKQLPDVYTLIERAAGRLAMPTPDVFIVQNPTINAYAIGFFGKKSVILNSATVESMSDSELSFILGHEFSHIKCGHTNWLVFTTCKDALYVPLVSDVLGLAFSLWSRKAEYTCDRAGLIACDDLRSSIGALVKVAVGKHLSERMNADEFFRQKGIVDTDDVSKFSELLESHPYIVNRVYALESFSQSPKYGQLLQMVTNQAK